LVVGCGGGGGGGGGGTSYVAPSVTSTTYSGPVQTIHYSDGSAVTNNASSSSASWASDHVTKTTSYTYANGGANTAVETVTPTAGTPSYSINTQTITSTYGDGYTSTATNTATSSPITWASDHITKTTTYTFANGGTNPVVATVNPTVSTPALTAAVYSGDWATVGTVIAPTVSAKNNVYGDGYTSAIEDGSLSKPFSQTTLSGLSITDPSKYVTSTTATYNLIWGIPDKNGPGFANLYPNPTNNLASARTYMGVTVTNLAGTAGPTVVQPSADTLAAWNAGWTGKGVNILLIDGYSTIGTCNNTTNDCHGARTMMIAYLVAPGATKYGATAYTNLTLAVGRNGTTGVNLGSSANINVVNMSVDASSWGDSGNAPTPTSAQWTSDINTHAAGNATYVSVLNGNSSISNIGGLSSAVLVKAAGNDAIDAKYASTSYTLAQDANAASRLLIVGALDKNGSVASPATLAWYSNKAGSDSSISSRFLVANGTAPYAVGAVKINGAVDNSSLIGTSYAAPVVAGYAAVVLQKFPNLTAASTSNILLDTARYDTLSCYPNCPTSTYGAGEASLSRALAPVGRLR